MNLKRNSDKNFSVDISSLVDVLFTLLIFFSLTSTFVKESGLKIDLPQASADVPLTASEKYEIGIAADGRIEMNGVAMESVEEVKKVLSKFDDTMRLKYIMVIKADTATQHGEVTKILDILKSLKFENIAVATKAKG